MSLEDIRTGMRKVSDSFLSHLSTMMAFVLILYGVVGIYYKSYELAFAILINISPIICGILILLDRHRSIFWAVGLYAVGIGLSRFISNLPGVFDDSLYEFIFCLIYCIMGANLIYSGSRYIRGNSRSIIFILLGTMVFIILSFITLTMGIIGFTDFESFFIENAYSLVNLLIYLLYMGLVWSEPVRNSTNASIGLRLSAGVRIVDGSMKKASIHDSTGSEILEFFDNKESNTNKEGLEGPIYSEYDFTFKDGFKTNYGRLQRWNGPEGKIFMILSEHDSGSFISVYSKQVVGARIEGNYLIIDTADRGEAFFRIRDVDEEDGPILFSKIKATGGDEL